MKHWWRAYDEALDDPKLQRLPGDLFKAWFNILCLASRNDGVIPSDAARLSFALRCNETQATKWVRELVEMGLLEQYGRNFTPHNWNGRQYSHVSTGRVRRYRQKRKQDGVEQEEEHHAETPVGPIHETGGETGEGTGSETGDETSDETVNETPTGTPTETPTETLFDDETGDETPVKQNVTPPDSDSEKIQKENPQGGSGGEASASVPIVPDKRGTRISPNWQPNVTDFEYALRYGMSPDDIDLAVEQFVNYWSARAGREAVKLDWSRTWKNRVLDLAQRKGQPNGKYGRRQGESLSALAGRLADEARAMERNHPFEDDAFGSD